MARDVTDRIKKYTRKLKPERIAQDLTEGRDDMIAKNAYRQQELMVIENKVRQILDTAGVSTIEYPKYFNFGRQVWKAKRKYGGKTFENELDILFTVWTKREAKPEILKTIGYWIASAYQPPAAPE